MCPFGYLSSKLQRSNLNELWSKILHWLKSILRRGVNRAGRRADWKKSLTPGTKPFLSPLPLPLHLPLSRLHLFLGFSLHTDIQTRKGGGDIVPAILCPRPHLIAEDSCPRHSEGSVVPNLGTYAGWLSSMRRQRDCEEYEKPYGSGIVAKAH